MRNFRALALFCAFASSAGGPDVAAAQDRPDEQVVALARALDARLTVWKTPDGRVVHVQHCRNIKDGCRKRVVTFAQWIVEAAERHEIDPFMLAAMAIRESGLDPFAHGAAGERGIVQLHPRGVGSGVRFVQSKAYRRYCRRQAGACQQEVLDAGARLVSKAIEQCGDVGAGLGAYNSGVCGENAYARRVLAERKKLVQLSRKAVEGSARQMVD